MRTKIILECGYNHGGSVAKAKQMIDEASKLKVWAVKFQKWDVENFPKYIKDIKYKERQTYYSHRKKVELSIKQLLELKKYSEAKGLEFVCSGKDFNSIKALVEAGFKWIKLPSQRYMNHKIFTYLVGERRKRGFKIMVSTGMHRGPEILKSKWPKLANVIMYCISLYPAEIEDCNFGFMRKYKFYNGYSSHELKGEGIKYAVMCGAEYIERHFAIEETEGQDKYVSSDPKEIKKIIRDIKKVEIVLGDGRRNVTGDEFKVRKFFKEF